MQSPGLHHAFQRPEKKQKRGTDPVVERRRSIARGLLSSHATARLPHAFLSYAPDFPTHPYTYSQSSIQCRVSETRDTVQ